MTKDKQPDKPGGLANLSVNSSRRSGTSQDGVGNPARKDHEVDSTKSTRVPDEQAPRK